MTLTPGTEPEGVAKVGARGRGQRLPGDHRRRYRRIDDPDLGARRGDDHRVAEARQRQGYRRQLDECAGDGDVMHRRIGKAGQSDGHGIGARGEPRQTCTSHCRRTA